MTIAILGTSRPAAAEDAEWTVMVYLAADNNLESFGIDDFLEMSGVGSDGDVQIVVLLDRIPGEDSSYDNWTDARRGLVQPGDEPDSSWGQSVGEVNMGDPQTLIDFVEWSVQNYPATRYGLILWDHGNGWWPATARPAPVVKGIAYDDTSGSDGLAMSELRQALDTITATTGKLDLIGFDACLMAMVEVAYDLSGYASIMVASQNNEPGRGWQMRLRVELFFVLLHEFHEFIQ